MKEILHSGSEQLEILEADEGVLQFPTLQHAVEFLRRLSKDQRFISVLRSLLSERSIPARRLSTEQMLREMGLLLVSGRIRILRTVRRAGHAPASEEEEPKNAASKSGPAANKSWIEINLRDEAEQPVPGARYRIKLPDASTQEGNLDGYGHAEYYNINNGVCEVSFPEIEDDEWYPA